MTHQTKVFIEARSDGKRILVDGSLDLFRELLTAFSPVDAQPKPESEARPLEGEVEEAKDGSAQAT